MARESKAAKAEDKVVEKVEVKGYKFTSTRPYLLVHAVGAQFRKGEFVTDNEQVAEYLRHLEDVTEEK